MNECKFAKVLFIKLVLHIIDLLSKLGVELFDSVRNMLDINFLDAFELLGLIVFVILDLARRSDRSRLLRLVVAIEIHFRHLD